MICLAEMSVSNYGTTNSHRTAGEPEIPGVNDMMLMIT